MLLYYSDSLLFLFCIVKKKESHFNRAWKLSKVFEYKFHILKDIQYTSHYRNYLPYGIFIYENFLRVFSPFSVLQYSAWVLVVFITDLYLSIFTQMSALRVLCLAPPITPVTLETPQLRMIEKEEAPKVWYKDYLLSSQLLYQHASNFLNIIYIYFFFVLLSYSIFWKQKKETLASRPGKQKEDQSTAGTKDRLLVLNLHCSTLWIFQRAIIINRLVEL